MSGSGVTTVIVLLLGGVFCWSGVTGGWTPGHGAGGDRGDDAPAAIRSLHRDIARRLRREGDVEAAEWHQRIAEGKPAEEADVADAPGPAAPRATADSSVPATVGAPERRR